MHGRLQGELDIQGGRGTKPFHYSLLELYMIKVYKMSNIVNKFFNMCTHLDYGREKRVSVESKVFPHKP